MVLRKQNLEIYENTVTAMVYRETRPHVHIIEDTSDPRMEYAELYPSQTERIRSSIVYPVLSETTELLGTLVVHCDSSGFFLNKDLRNWSDLLEVFAKRIALVKKRLDLLSALGAATEQIEIPGVPF